MFMVTGFVMELFWRNSLCSTYHTTFHWLVLIHWDCCHLPHCLPLQSKLCHQSGWTWHSEMTHQTLVSQFFNFHSSSATYFHGYSLNLGTTWKCSTSGIIYFLPHIPDHGFLSFQLYQSPSRTPTKVIPLSLWSPGISISSIYHYFLLCSLLPSQ